MVLFNNIEILCITDSHAHVYIQDRNIKWPMLFNIKLAQVDIVCYDIQQKTSEQLLLIPATATTEQEGSWLMDFVVFNSIVHD